MRIFEKRVWSLGLSLLLATATQMQAQDVVSGIFGYQNLTLLGNSDTIVALPFARWSASTVTVSSFASSVITVQGTPGWTASQFVYASGTQSNTYYVRIESGALEGKYFDITNNTTTTLALNLKGGSLTGLAANDQISVVPYWTLGSVFANGNGIHLSTSTIARKTEVIIPDLTGLGINLSSSATYYYYTNAGTVVWRKTVDANTHDDDVFQPNTYLVIRHKIATNTTFTSFGDVVLTKVNIPLLVNTTNKQDNFVGLPRPINVSLNDAGLITSGAFASSSSTISRRDELLVFDNAETNFNKASLATYYYLSSQWRRVGDTTDYAASNIFVSGAGYILRKASTNVIPNWTNAPTY